MLGISLATLTLGAEAQESTDPDFWVSDDLTTFVRSGPTDGYRIVGTLTAGDPVELLETSGDYSLVQGPGGDQVWILSSNLQDEKSATAQLPALQERVETLSDELEASTSNGKGGLHLRPLPLSSARRGSRTSKAENKRCRSSSAMPRKSARTAGTVGYPGRRPAVALFHVRRWRGRGRPTGGTDRSPSAQASQEKRSLVLG